MIAAVVPVKAFRRAKSRLSPHLSQNERVALMRKLVTRTVTVLRESGCLANVALATSEIELATELGTQIVPEQYDLNSTLKQAATWAKQLGASGLLILPADLPLIDGSDIVAITATHFDPRTVCIAGTKDGGTAALFLTPPEAIEPRFGHDSFRRHIEAAELARIPVHIHTRPNLALDLDTINDLRSLPDAGTLPFSADKGVVECLDS